MAPTFRLISGRGLWRTQSWLETMILISVGQEAHRMGPFPNALALPFRNWRMTWLRKWSQEGNQRQTEIQRQKHWAVLVDTLVDTLVFKIHCIYLPVAPFHRVGYLVRSVDGRSSLSPSSPQPSHAKEVRDMWLSGFMTLLPP